MWIALMHEKVLRGASHAVRQCDAIRVLLLYVAPHCRHVHVWSLFGVMPWTMGASKLFRGLERRVGGGSCVGDIAAFKEIRICEQCVE